jgi:hypothetical protein
MRTLLLLAAVLSTSCAHVPAGPPPEVREVALREGTVRVVVEGQPVWARYVADRAAAFLPAAEQYFDIPFHRAAAGMFHGLPQPWTVRIVGSPRVMLGTVHIGAYNNTSGVFGSDRGIFMEYGFSHIGDPALVMHEVGHDWLHGRGAALAPGVQPPWGQWAVPKPDADVAIQHDPRRQGGVGIFYGKSYRVQLFTARELGADGYRSLLQATAGHTPSTNEEALMLLHSVRADVDWAGLLRGWVLDGPYGKYAPADIPGLMPER